MSEQAVMKPNSSIVDNLEELIAEDVLNNKDGHCYYSNFKTMLEEVLTAYKYTPQLNIVLNYSLNHITTMFNASRLKELFDEDTPSEELDRIEQKLQETSMMMSIKRMGQ